MKGKLSPFLTRWCQDPQTENCSVILRVKPSEDLAATEKDLKEKGMKIQSIGPRVVVGEVSPSSLNRIAQLDYVTAIEEPMVRHQM